MVQATALDERIALLRRRLDSIDSKRSAFFFVASAQRLSHHATSYCRQVGRADLADWLERLLNSLWQTTGDAEDQIEKQTLIRLEGIPAECGDEGTFQQACLLSLCVCLYNAIALRDGSRSLQYGDIDYCSMPLVMRATEQLTGFTDLGSSNDRGAIEAQILEVRSLSEELDVEGSDIDTLERTDISLQETVSLLRKRAEEHQWSLDK